MKYIDILSTVSRKIQICCTNRKNFLYINCLLLEGLTVLYKKETFGIFIFFLIPVFSIIRWFDFRSLSIILMRIL